MAVSLGSRIRLFKDALSSTCRVKALLKPYASYPPKSVKKWDEIPGPETLPIVGNLWDYYQGKYTLHDLPKIYEGYFKTYGPLVKEYVYYGKTIVHVFDPEDMASIYGLDLTNYPYRVSHTALAEYRRKMSYRNGGLPSTNGEIWAELRRLLGDDLLKPHHSEAFEIVAKDFVNKIYKLIAFKPNRQLALWPWVDYWALECMTVFSLGQSSEVFTLDGMNYTPFQQYMISLRDSQEIAFYTENLPWFFTRGLRKRLEDRQEFMYLFLSNPMSYPVFKRYEFEDILPPGIVVEGATICLANSLAHDLVSRDVDDRDVRTFIIDMFQGGIQAPAHVLAFSMYYLAKHPEEQKKVRNAIKRDLKKDGDKSGSRPVCKEINNVILETMRLNPPTIGTGRVLPQPLVMSNYLVPKGARCILHHQIASKNKDNFENPDQFIPDRFNVSQSAKAQVANSPFALGKRQCPGKDVAMNELGITLRRILTHFELGYDYETVGTRSGLFNEADKQIIMTFKPAPLT